MERDEAASQRPRLNSVRIQGFRSIRTMDLQLGSMNVLVGANGAGKSNLIAFFKLINEMMGHRLQLYVAVTGSATANLHFGPKVTPELEATLSVEVENGTDTYSMRLSHAAGDALLFEAEKLSFHERGHPSPRVTDLGSGHHETRLRDAADRGDATAKPLRHCLDRFRVFHFHDTTSSARVRNHCYVGDNRWLMPDAGNVAAILYRLKTEDAAAYRRIVATIRQVAPPFMDFVLDPGDSNSRQIILNWRQRGADSLFGPHQFSDGTLRAICLTTLCLQPTRYLPHLIVVDEPELGLHPAALGIVAGLLRAASQSTQVLVSTQSSAFVDHFDAEDIVVVENRDGASQFARPNAEILKDWLEDYSLGEVWEKNIVGGGPY